MPRCKHSLFYFVSVLIMLAAGLVSCRTVEVLEGPLTLIQALQDSSVDIIVLGGDYSVGKELPGPLPAPIQLRRWVRAHPAAQQQIQSTAGAASVATTASLSVGTTANLSLNDV
jgi:hypothetical protein